MTLRLTAWCAGLMICQRIDAILSNCFSSHFTHLQISNIETLKESSVDFLVRPFCEGAHYFDVLYSVPEQTKKALDAANLEIPCSSIEKSFCKKEMREVLKARCEPFLIPIIFHNIYYAPLVCGCRSGFL